MVCPAEFMIPFTLKIQMSVCCRSERKICNSPPPPLKNLRKVKLMTVSDYNGVYKDEFWSSNWNTLHPWGLKCRLWAWTCNSLQVFSFKTTPEKHLMCFLQLWQSRTISRTQMNDVIVSVHAISVYSVHLILGVYSAVTRERAFG